MADQEPKKAKGLLEDIAEIPGEVMPEDLRKYMLRTTEALTRMVEKVESPALERLQAAKQVEGMYQTVLAKWLSKDFLDKTDRTNNRALNAVQEQRKKPWDKGDGEE